MPDEHLKMIIEMKEDIASIKSTLHSMADTNQMALEALQSSRSAHHRIDELIKRLEQESQEARLGQRWLVGTTVSVAALFMTAIGLLWKLLESN